MGRDHPDWTPVLDEVPDAGDQHLRLPAGHHPGGSVARQLGARPVLLRHLEPDPGEGVGRVHLQVVHGGAAVAGVVGVRHQEGGAAPVQEDDLVEHERGAFQQAVLQLPAEQAPALLQDEGSLALLQVQLLQQTLALSLGGYEDLGLNIKSGSERREERGERRD